MPKLTLGPWNNYGTFCQAQLKVNNIRVYDIIVNTRTPQPGQWTPKERRCHTNRAAQISCYIGDLWQASRSWPLKATAVMLAEMGASPNDLEAFFKAVADMEWEDDLILEASQAACEILPPTEPSTYLVVKIWRGIVSEYVYLPMAEAQQAIADYCSIDVTDIVYRTGLPFGDVYSASDEMDYDAWAFPVYDSGESIEMLSRQLEYALRAKAELFEEYARVCAELRILRKAYSGGD